MMTSAVEPVTPTTLVQKYEVRTHVFGSGSLSYRTMACELFEFNFR